MTRQEFEYEAERVLSRYHRVINNLTLMACHPRLQGVIGFSVAHSVTFEKTSLSIYSTRHRQLWCFDYPIMRYEAYAMMSATQHGAHTVEIDTQLLAAERLIQTLLEELLYPVAEQGSQEHLKQYAMASASGALNPVMLNEADSTGAFHA